MDPYLRLTFITGVTKFTRMAIFSGLNNLLDITLLDDYANICGITIDDLKHYFSDRIEALSGRKGFENLESVHDEILNWYDGYTWDGEGRVIASLNVNTHAAETPIEVLTGEYLPLLLQTAGAISADWAACQSAPQVTVTQPVRPAPAPVP